MRKMKMSSNANASSYFVCKIKTFSRLNHSHFEKRKKKQTLRTFSPTLIFCGTWRTFPWSFGNLPFLLPAPHYSPVHGWNIFYVFLYPIGDPLDHPLFCRRPPEQVRRKHNSSEQTLDQHQNAIGQMYVKMDKIILMVVFIKMTQTCASLNE